MRAIAGSRAQRGLTILGFMLVAAVVVIFVMVGFRVMPSYIEYIAVKRALQETLNSAPEVTNVQQFRRNLEGRLDVNYVDSIKASDVQLVREGNTITAYVNWDRKLHMVSNAYILLEFQAAASR